MIDIRTKIILLLIAFLAGSINAQEEIPEPVKTPAKYGISAYDSTAYVAFINRPYLDLDPEYYKENYTSRAYNYVDTPNKERTFKKSKKRNFLPGSLIGTILKIIFVIIIGLAVLALIMVVKDLDLRKKSKIESITKDKTISKENDLNAPEALDQHSLYELLKKSEQANNYRSAVRCHFLIYLEKLQTRKEIVYNKDKTNADYLREIENKDSGAVFSQLSYLYEYVWYGNKSINAVDYENIAFTFDKSLKK